MCLVLLNCSDIAGSLRFSNIFFSVGGKNEALDRAVLNIFNTRIKKNKVSKMNLILVM